MSDTGGNVEVVAARRRTWDRAPAVTRAALAAGALGAIVAGVVLRAWPRSALWLDEAQSVAFARLPLTAIPAALREDGAPPLYYLLLHGWIRLFGDSDIAVRSLSVVASIAGLVALAAAARRVAGRAAVWPVVLVAATNPFAIRYASETRMYALVMLEAALGVLAVTAALARPTTRNLAAVAGLTAALLYTHYWGLHLVAATALVLGWQAWRRRSGGADRPPSPPGEGRRRVLVLLAVGAGAVAWLPWVPSFLFQAAHTGTPWTPPATLASVLSVLPEQSGGAASTYGPTLAVLLAGLIAFAVVGLAGSPAPERRRTRVVRSIAAVAVLTPVLAAVGGMVSHSAFVARYTAVVFPLVALLAGIGATRIPQAGARALALGLVATLGLQGGVAEASTARTPAASFATALERDAQPGDVIVFCPDQLGPALTRELEGTRVAWLASGVYPTWASADRVNWVDYGNRYADPARAVDFARSADARAGEHSVWLVWSTTYPPTGASCAALADALRALRPIVSHAVIEEPRYSDPGGLTRFEPGRAAPVG
jgi:hypothetical protein